MLRQAEVPGSKPAIEAEENPGGPTKMARKIEYEFIKLENPALLKSDISKCESNLSAIAEKKNDLRKLGLEKQKLAIETKKLADSVGVLLAELNNFLMKELIIKEEESVKPVPVRVSAAPKKRAKKAVKTKKAKSKKWDFGELRKDIKSLKKEIRS